MELPIDRCFQLSYTGGYDQQLNSIVSWKRLRTDRKEVSSEIRNEGVYMDVEKQKPVHNMLRPTIVDKTSFFFLQHDASVVLPHAERETDVLDIVCKGEILKDRSIGILRFYNVYFDRRPTVLGDNHVLRVRSPESLHGLAQFLERPMELTKVYSGPIPPPDSPISAASFANIMKIKYGYAMRNINRQAGFLAWFNLMCLDKQYVIYELDEDYVFNREDTHV